MSKQPPVLRPHFGVKTGGSGVSIGGGDGFLGGMILFIRPDFKWGFCDPKTIILRVCFQPFGTAIIHMSGQMYIVHNCLGKNNSNCFCFFVSFSWWLGCYQLPVWYSHVCIEKFQKLPGSPRP